MERALRRIAGALARRIRCQWAAWRARASSDTALKAGPVRSVLVVCYGNIYRSPYAAALLRRLLDGHVRVRSGGFHPVVGRRSPEPVLRFAACRGLDLAPHRSTLVTVDDIARADLVVVMDRHNWEAVRAAGGAARIAWLGVLDGGIEIPDPYGGDEADVETILGRLHRCAEILAGRIEPPHDSAAT